MVAKQDDIRSTENNTIASFARTPSKKKKKKEKWNKVENFRAEKCRTASLQP